MKINLTDFQRDHAFYGNIDIVATIKSFNLQAIRERYLKSQKNVSGRSGSVERRKVDKGGIVSMSLENGALKLNEEFRGIPEPRGIDLKKKTFSFSAEKEVYILWPNGEKQTISNPWFSYIHTVELNRNITKLLVSSSGFDMILEYDLDSKKQSAEWLAWENGFDKAVDPNSGKPFRLTRNSELKNEDGYKVIDDPENQVLPTAMRSAFINSVSYCEDEKNVLATFFHEGAVFKINLSNGQSQKLLSGMKKPHGGREIPSGFMATSTATGEVFLRIDGSDRKIDFTKLPGKPDFLSDAEWLQNTIYLDENFITIDSNRTSFVIFNLNEEKFDVIPFDDNWAVQDLVSGTLSDAQKEFIQTISQEST
ncbi:hypothetical protein [Salibacter halophilus]|uniref:Uncharacterized protein n=1 Tax=Salibacter halophilus TaxID=1803916 RepID=A0A6N6M461_9FLAO|nr:hypothetical protein [Salibacter halophilus]KAB1062664.1 hypothetical protein F3059_12010 [Salibacter halophilus]